MFAGQRREGFYVDLGSIFDLGDLRPFEARMRRSASRRWRPRPASTRPTDFSVHSIALKVPKADLTRDGTTPTDPTSQDSVIGVWASASRAGGGDSHAVVRHVHEAGEWVQVSRLGNPLFNEVIVPMGYKDQWNSLPPSADNRFLRGVQHPELASTAPRAVPGSVPEPRGADSRRARTSWRFC